MSDRLNREELSDGAYQIKEVYAHYGLAMYLGQTLEKGVLNVLTMAQTAASESPTTATWDRFFATNAELTLGMLLREIAPHMLEENELFEALRSALTDRNRLAHNFFWDHAPAFLDFAGRERMLEELFSMQGTFEVLSGKLSSLIETRYFRSDERRAWFDRMKSEETESLREQVRRSYRD
jgi:hypothetical protein